MIRVLREHGWTIFEPEQHGIIEQLQMLESASHVAGFMGSAFHALILLKSFGGRITMFSRGAVNGNFTTIAQARQLDQKIIELPMERKSGSGPNTRWSLSDLGLVLGPLEVARSR